MTAPNSPLSSTGSKIEGFLSYSHAADEALGCVAPLHKSLVDMIKLKANREIEIFRDRESIAWGDRWEASIRGGLEGSSVMFVVATTHYLDSDACRDEFTTFLNAARATGREQASKLILPIMPIDAAGVFNKSSDDPIARAIAEIQYELIEEAVIEGPGSPAWRRAMLTLANRFISVVNAAEQALSPEADFGESRWPRLDSVARGQGSDGQGTELGGEEGDSDLNPIVDERGLIDLTVDIHQDIQDATAIIVRMSSQLSGLSETTKKFDFSNSSSPKDVAAKLQNLARSLGPESQALGTSGHEVRRLVVSVDMSLRRLVALQNSTNDETEIAKIREQLVEIQENLESATVVEDQMNGLLGSMESAEKASSVIRKALQPMRSGLTAFSDSLRIMKQWGPGLLDEV